MLFEVNPRLVLKPQSAAGLRELEMRRFVKRICRDDYFQSLARSFEIPFIELQDGPQPNRARSLSDLRPDLFEISQCRAKVPGQSMEMGPMHLNPCRLRIVERHEALEFLPGFDRQADVEQAFDQTML